MRHVFWRISIEPVKWNVLIPLWYVSNAVKAGMEVFRLTLGVVKVGTDSDCVCHAVCGVISRCILSKSTSYCVPL